MIMRKKIICFILVAVMVVLTACGNVDAETETIYIQDCSYYEDDMGFEIVIDKATGVNYIIFEGYKQGGITPRYNADGTLYTSLCK